MTDGQISGGIGVEINEIERHVDKINIMLTMIENDTTRHEMKYKAFQEIRDILIQKGVIS